MKAAADEKGLQGLMHIACRSVLQHQQLKQHSCPARSGDAAAADAQRELHDAPACQTCGCSGASTSTGYPAKHVKHHQRSPLGGPEYL